MNPVAQQSFLNNYVARGVETLAAPPQHDIIGKFTREAFAKSRLKLHTKTDVKIIGKPGIGTGFVIKVFSSTARAIRYKQMLRLRAYMQQYFTIKDMTVVPAMYSGRAVLDFTFLITGLKSSAKAKVKG